MTSSMLAPKDVDSEVSLWPNRRPIRWPPPSAQTRRRDSEETPWSVRNKEGDTWCRRKFGSTLLGVRVTETLLYTHCLVCHTPFPANEELEHFSTSNRVAYDAERGRLWAICRSCKRWSLAPIEERWEALEELEKLVKDRAKLLSQTDNVALLRAGELDVVRVGRANLTEEAWWRYVHFQDYN